jgi:hypothetical protein
VQVSPDTARIVSSLFVPLSLSSAFSARLRLAFSIICRMPRQVLPPDAGCFTRRVAGYGWHLNPVFCSECNLAFLCSLTLILSRRAMKNFAVSNSRRVLVPLNFAATRAGRYAQNPSCQFAIGASDDENLYSARNSLRPGQGLRAAISWRW